MAALSAASDPTVLSSGLPADLVTEAAIVNQLAAETGRSARSIRDALRRHLRRKGVVVTKIGVTRLFPAAALRATGPGA